MAFVGSCVPHVWLGPCNLLLRLLVAYPIVPCCGVCSWFLLPGWLPLAALGYAGCSVVVQLHPAGPPSCLRVSMEYCAHGADPCFAIHWPVEHVGRDSSWHVLVRYAWVGLTCCVTKPLSQFGLVFASVLTMSSPLCFVSGSWSFLPIDAAVTGVHSLPCSLWLLAKCIYNARPQ